MQKTMIIGNLTHNPERHTTPNGVDVCTFTVAVNRRNGQEQTADFYRVNAWRGLAETCGKYLAKGRKVFVMGELNPRLYDGRDGEKRLSLDLNADTVEFLTPKSEQTEQPSEPAPVPDENGFFDVKAEDIPF